MTRMIERWFPCAEVSKASGSGWGHGKVEKTLFPWFAARPPAQAKAAVVCSLLPWPEQEGEQLRLQALVQNAMTGRHAAWNELRREILVANPAGATVLDPFSGRGMIPLEAARLGLPSYAIDYSPMAVLGSRILTDYPFRDWSGEPPIPFQGATETSLNVDPRIVSDVRRVLTEVGQRYHQSMQEFYPRVGGLQPWAYLWAVTLPCLECGHRFPLFASNELRRPSVKRGKKGAAPLKDSGQSFSLEVDRASGRFRTVVYDGPPQTAPTLVNARDASGKKIAGKSAACPFCAHPHPLAVHRRLTHEGLGRDHLLVVADLDTEVGRVYRSPEAVDHESADQAEKALVEEPNFAPGVPAVPNEGIAPGNNNIIGPSIYGVKTFGRFMPSRQTLAFVRLARSVGAVADELLGSGLSAQYTSALCEYAAAVIARKVRRSGRAATLDINVQAAHDIYSNQGSIGYSYDFIEVGLGVGQGTWDSIAASEVTTLRNITKFPHPGSPTQVARGSATSLPFRDASMAVVVTDPPYDQMLAYSDSSDVIYVWVKRAIGALVPELLTTSDPHGAQEKFDEIIVKRVRGEAPLEHRTREHYDTKMGQAFREMRRVVGDDGLVTIVFGSGDPDVWRRLLDSFHQAGLVMTGSWPANTESGSHQGKANIETTLTMACRPAPTGRKPGRKGAVEAEIKAAIKERFVDWERWGLAPADMLMAAAGPAMEVVGRYSEVHNARGAPVDIHTFLPLARSAVQEAMAVEIDHHPLDTFDARTSFALWWVRLYSRQVQAKSELRWQALAASMELADVRDLVPDADKGVQFVTANGHKGRITNEASVIDVALALAAASDEGLAAMGEVLAVSGRDPQDAYLWAAVKFLADRLPDADPDSISFSRVLRTREGIASAAQAVVAGEQLSHQRRLDENAQQRLL